MPIYKIKLISKKTVANNTVEFTFEKPENFSFVPGQYGGFTLIEPKSTDAKGNTRRFSILSSPDESHLRIVTRVQQSAFKQSINALNINDEIKFAGPTGSFVMHNESTVPTVFIAGGIGIAPFYSMILHAAKNHLSQPMQLFYGNQSEGDTAFLDELQTLNHPAFQLIPVMANPSEQWKGETGYITHTLLKKHIADINIPYYYVCGSPAMVAAINELLLEMGINSDRIRVEDFPGY